MPPFAWQTYLTSARSELERLKVVAAWDSSDILEMRAAVEASITTSRSLIARVERILARRVRGTE